MCVNNQSQTQLHGCVRRSKVSRACLGHGAVLSCPFKLTLKPEWKPEQIDCSTIHFFAFLTCTHTPPNLKGDFQCKSQNTAQKALRVILKHRNGAAIETTYSNKPELSSGAGP